MKTHTSKFCSSENYNIVNIDDDEDNNNNYDYSSHEKMNSLIQYSDLILNEALAANCNNVLNNGNKIFISSSEDSNEDLNEDFNELHTSYILSFNSTCSSPTF